jgi:hypothetical protein
MFYEFKKLTSSKLFWVALVILLGYLSVFIYSASAARVDKSANDNAKSLLSEILQSGEPPERIIADLNTELNNALSANDTEKITVYGDVLSLYSYVNLNFPNNRKSIIEDTVYNLAEEKSKTNPDKYYISSNELAIEKYNNVVPLKSKFTLSGDFGYFDLMFNYTVWDYVFLAFIVLISVRMFTIDGISGTYQVINTSKKGARGLFFKKLTSCFSVITVILLIQAVAEIVIGIKCYGLENLGLPIHQINIFEMCPFQISIAGYFAAKFFVKLILFFMVCVVASLISILVKKPLLSNVLGIVVGCSGALLNLYFYMQYNDNRNTEMFESARAFLPQSLLNPLVYFNQFDYFNFFGTPVNRLTFCVSITVLISLFCIIFGYAKTGKREK